MSILPPSVHWNDLVEIGRTVGTHGFQGTLKIELEVDFDSLSEDLEFVFMDIEGSIVPLRLEFIEEGRPFLAKFDNSPTSSDHKAMLGRKLFVSKGDISESAESISSAKDLVGKRLIADPEQAVGTVIDLVQGLYQDRLVVQTETKQIEVPFPEEWIETIGEEVIVMNLPEGLLDL